MAKYVLEYSTGEWDDYQFHIVPLEYEEDKEHLLTYLELEVVERREQIINLWKESLDVMAPYNKKSPGLNQKDKDKLMKQCLDKKQSLNDKIEELRYFRVGSKILSVEDFTLYDPYDGQGVRFDGPVIYSLEEWFEIKSVGQYR